MENLQTEPKLNEALNLTHKVQLHTLTLNLTKMGTKACLHQDKQFVDKQQLGCTINIFRSY